MAWQTGHHAPAAVAVASTQQAKQPSTTLGAHCCVSVCQGRGGCTACLFCVCAPLLSRCCVCLLLFTWSLNMVAYVSPVASATLTVIM
jgi:predicted GNAT family acetyltransferase